MKGKERKQQILRVAEQIFAEKGYSEATMRDIAEKVSMKKPSIYHHFRSKEEIYYTLILDIYRRIIAEVSDIIRQKDKLEEKIELVIERMVDFWAQHPNYPTILAYEIATGSEIITSELIPKVWGPGYMDAVEELRSAQARQPEFAGVDIPILIVNLMGMPIFYFYTSHIFSHLMEEDCLSDEMLARLKKEIKKMVIHGIKKPRGDS